MVGLLQLVNQTQMLTRANLTSRYRRTVAGFFWVTLNPLTMFAVQSYVFKNILNIQIDNYSVFLLGGLLPWLFIFQTIDMTTPLLVNSSQLLKSAMVNPIVLISAQIADSCINFIFQFFIIFLIFLVNKSIPIGAILLVFVPILLLFTWVFSISWIFSTLHVFFRDTRFLVNFLLNIVFFITPIFYPVELIPAHLRWILFINPLYYLINPFRLAIYHFEQTTFVEACAKGAIISLVTLFGAILLWKKTRNEIYYQF
jgi:lipopolysaccharide transport system permease protein